MEEKPGVSISGAAEEEAFGPTPGDHCAYCNDTEICNTGDDKEGRSLLLGVPSGLSPSVAADGVSLSKRSLVI